MDTTTLLISAGLVVMIVRQLRGRRLGFITIGLPLVIVAAFSVDYLHGISTQGADLTLEVACALIGVLLGALCAVFTTVFRNAAGVVMCKATPLALALWVIGIAARIGFQLFATNGGGPAIMAFSAANHISIDGWTAALIFMSLGEVLARGAGLGMRWLLLNRAAGAPAVAAAR